MGCHFSGKRWVSIIVCMHWKYSDGNKLLSNNGGLKLESVSERYLSPTTIKETSYVRLLFFFFLFFFTIDRVSDRLSILSGFYCNGGDQSRKFFHTVFRRSSTDQKAGNEIASAECTETPLGPIKHATFSSPELRSYWSTILDAGAMLWSNATSWFCDDELNEVCMSFILLRSLLWLVSFFLLISHVT